ncbi:MAG TPA: aldo/keto reductase [Candidatus Binatia bacterium]|jgi:aryl-alcohol dehydrogenase-like predicted oxidoreductase
MKLQGWATAEGTERYRKRFEGKIPSGHFRQSQGLWLSSIGIGTYLGNHDTETDRLYRDAIVRAVESGCNVIDTAINYRCQRSERSIGTALKELASRGFDRDELVIATKGGFIPYDGAPPRDVRSYFEATFVTPGVAQLADVVAGCHCITPRYLLNQLDCSLRNLDLECVDIYYVHNPETQLGKITRQEFSDRLLRAFEALESAVAAGKTRLYGAATWNGYRNEPAEKDYLALSDTVEMAAKAGGKANRFKVIQLPLNLGMTEALSLSNQPVEGKQLTVLEAAQALGITVMCSASVLQGQLTRNLPSIINDTFQSLETDGQRALQFVRSTPGVTTALVGMKQLSHVEENLKTAQVPPASWEQYSKLFQSEEPSGAP